MSLSMLRTLFWSMQIIYIFTVFLCMILEKDKNVQTCQCSQSESILKQLTQHMRYRTIFLTGLLKPKCASENPRMGDYVQKKSLGQSVICLGGNLNKKSFSFCNGKSHDYLPFCLYCSSFLHNLWFLWH